MADKRVALGSEPVIRVGLVDDKGRWLALEGVSIRLSVDGGDISETEVATGEDGTADVAFTAPGKKGKVTVKVEIMGINAVKSRVIRVKAKP